MFTKWEVGKMKKVRLLVTLMVAVVLFLMVVMLGDILLLTKKDLKEQYTLYFLNSCSKNELVVVTRKNNKGREISGIVKDGKFIEPHTNEDKAILRIINIANSEFVSTSMQVEYQEVNEKDIEEKVEVISRKFPEKQIFVGEETKIQEDGEEYKEKRIYSYPKDYIVPNVEKIE